MDAAAETKRRHDWLLALVIGRRPGWTLVRVAVVLVAAFVVFKFMLIPVRIEGPSMLPTFRDRGFNFISRNSFRNHEPRRGDVVAIRFAGVKAMLLKRIVALPGETIAFHHGLLVVDGKYIPEPYVLLPCDWEIAPETVAANEYFVVGDNRSMPERFHTKGRAPRERIVGKPIL